MNIWGALSKKSSLLTHYKKVKKEGKSATPTRFTSVDIWVDIDYGEKMSAGMSQVSVALFPSF